MATKKTKKTNSGKNKPGKRSNKIPKTINIKHFLETTGFGSVSETCHKAGQMLSDKKTPKKYRKAAASLLGSCFCSQTPNVKHYLKERNINTPKTICGSTLRKKSRKRKNKK